MSEAKDPIASNPAMLAMNSAPISEVSAEDFVAAVGAASSAQAEPRIKGLIDEIISLDPSTIRKVASILFSAALQALSGGDYVTIALTALKALLDMVKSR